MKNLKVKTLVFFLFLAATAILINIDRFSKIFESTNNTAFIASLANLKQLDSSQIQFVLNPESKNYIILHYWASWCSPCQTEMPKLFAAHKKLTEKFRIILISEDEDPSTGLLFLNDVGPIPSTDITFWDSDKNLSKSMGVFKLPETFIYNSKLELVRKIAGAMDWDDPKNLKYLNSLP